MLKDSAPEQLVATLRLAALGDALVTPRRTRALIERHTRPSAGGKAPGIDELTPRETEVLVLIARGLDNTEMGGRLHLSEATIRTHVGHILAKLQARSRVQAVVAAYESGLVQPGS
jgi:DNA-binding NarL/FixJ family response regulator